MTTPNPFDAMRLIVDRIRAIADELDLELVNIAFIPEDPDDYQPNPRNVVSAFFHIKPEAVKSAVEIENEKIDSDFAAIMGGLTIEEDEEGNITLGGDEPEEEKEPEKSEEEIRFEQRKDEAQRRLMKWIEGQDD